MLFYEWFCVLVGINFVNLCRKFVVFLFGNLVFNRLYGIVMDVFSGIVIKFGWIFFYGVSEIIVIFFLMVLLNVLML